MNQREQRHVAYYLSLLILATGVGCSCNGGGNDGGNGGASLGDRYDAALEITDPVDRGDEFIAIADLHIGSANSLGAKISLDEAKKAADDISAKKNAVNRAKAYLALADRWRQISEMDECEDAYDEAGDAVEKIEDPADKTGLLIDIALLKIKLEENDDAVKDLKAAETELKRIPDAQERVVSLSWIAYAHVQMDDKDEANRAMGLAINLAETEEKAGEKARLYALVGKEQIQSLGDSEAGMATIKKALEVAHTIEDNPNLLANVLIDIAETYKNLEEFGKARALLTEADELCQGRSECKPALRRIEEMRKEV